MTPTYKKKLIEVAIPLEAINAASAREKSIRHGHPSTLHLWWARRPLAACRAVLFAQLVDDPSSHPDQFPTHEDQERERQRLFAIIEDLVKWENSTNEEVLERARAEIRRSCGGVLPPVYDPFSGGGSIPLEAQRLGLPAYGSDLNPVAVVIGKAMIEIPPKFKDMPPIHPGIKERSFYRNAEGLAEDVKYYGEWMREKAWERIGHLYPQVDLPKEYGGGKATVIAWIWARTVPSPDPAFAHVHVPLVKSFELSKKPGNAFWVEPVVSGGNYNFEIRSSKRGDKHIVADGTVTRAGGRCLVSQAAMPFSYLREMAASGRFGQRLMAIVAEGPRGRVYLTPDEYSENLAASALPAEKPSLPISHWPGRTNVVEYGMLKFGDLFTDRQLVALNTLSDLVNEARKEIEKHAIHAGLAQDGAPLREGSLGARAYAEAVSVYLYFCIGKLTDLSNSLCRWEPVAQCPRNLFGRHAIPMIWDFAEGNVFSSSSGSFSVVLAGVSSAFMKNTFDYPNSISSIVQSNAETFSAPSSGAVISSDPPYYDNIGYADISDFFYVWMKKSLSEVYPDLFATLAVPKAEELVAKQYRHGGTTEAEAFFLTGMTKAMSNMASQHIDDFPASIFYAFKQSEVDEGGVSSTGWATFLQAVMNAGFAILGTWPMRTENSSRMIASGSNALANSVVLVCRKRVASAEITTRAEFIRALKRELPTAIADLQAANIAPADMPQSAIGPGMGVFSRYRAVLESDDSPMSVKVALQLINRELDEYLDGVVGAFDADTSFTIKWFELHGMKAGDFGSAITIAQAKGITVDSVKHSGIVESSAGKVRILNRTELDPDWQPEEDKHLTVWECCQHLIRLHEKHGIGLETAVMLRKIGAKADDVRDLAYVLYNICEKRGDAKEATAYNALIADWTDLTREAASAPLTTKSGQLRFEV